MSLMQNFSMNTLGSLTLWLKLIVNEVADLAVTKHSAHVRYYTYDNIIYVCS
jgi:hypothetical protein